MEASFIIHIRFNSCKSTGASNPSKKKKRVFSLKRVAETLDLGVVRSSNRRMDIPKWHSTEIAVQGLSQCPLTGIVRKWPLSDAKANDIDQRCLFVRALQPPRRTGTLPTVCLTSLLCYRRQVGLIPVPAYNAAFHTTLGFLQI